MILRSIETEGLGCFAGPCTAGPFAPGINVLYAPNGRGKTTLFRAVSLAFLEPHRGRSAELQALRPWGRRLSPEVAVDFEHCGRVYRIRKRFLDDPSARVDTREGDSWTPFAHGDNADEFLRELLLSESDKPRFARPEHWGLAQVLWTTQGDLSLPSLASSVIESIRASVGAQIVARDSAIHTRITEEYLKFFSPVRGQLRTGRNAAPLGRLEAERERLERELETAQAALRDFEKESDRIAQLQAAEASLNLRREALSKDLDRARDSAEQYTKLRSEQREREAARDAAQTRHKAIADRIRGIEQAREQAAACQASLADSDREIPRLRSRFEELQKAAGESDRARESAAAAEVSARIALQQAQTAGEYVRSAAAHAGLSQRLRDLGAARTEMESASRRIAELNAPSEARLRALRSALANETDARRRLDLARITVAFVPQKPTDIRVIAGEQPGNLTCSAGERLLLPGAPGLIFEIDGIGRFEATGPVADYAPVRALLLEQQASIAAFAAEFGTADPEALEARRRETGEWDAKIREIQKAVRKLLDGKSEPELREIESGLGQRIAAIEAEHPDWRSAPPDATAMTAAANSELSGAAARRNQAEAAAREAQRCAADARRELELAIDRRKNFGDQLDQARRLLDGCPADAAGDEDRRKQLHDALLDYDTCRLALERIECGLKAFAQDPAILVRKTSAEISQVEEQARKAREDRLRAETRIQGLVDRRPYAASNDLSERLAVLAGQIARERRRMDALSLLNTELEKARSEVMAAISAPVERIATDYLEEICGVPVAEIRLTQALAPERVIPSALAGTAELVELERLSGGEREQVFLCTRIALGCEVARRERQMVVLDDVLVSTDEARMERICRLLATVTDRLQVIILTCHPERFANLPGNRIDLAEAFGAKAIRVTA